MPPKKRKKPGSKPHTLPKKAKAQATVAEDKSNTTMLDISGNKHSKPKMKIFRLRSVEFGNTYHVAGAIICEPHKFLVDISECSLDQMIFLQNVLPTNNIIYNKISIKNNDIKSLNETTGVIARSKILAEKGSEFYRILYHAFINGLAHDDKRIISELQTQYTGIFHSLSKLQDINSVLKMINCAEELKMSLIERLSKRSKIEGFDEQQIEYKFLDYMSKIKELKSILNKNNKIIIHVRNLNVKDPHRNLRPDLLKLILQTAHSNKITEVIFIGDSLDQNNLEILKPFQSLKFHYLNKQNNKVFYETDEFKELANGDIIAGQICIYHLLFRSYNLKYAIGVKSGALDGLAFIGIPTLFFTLRDGQQGRMINAGKKILTLKHVLCGKNYDETNFDQIQQKLDELTKESTSDTTKDSALPEPSESSKETELGGNTKQAPSIQVSIPLNQEPNDQKTNATDLSNSMSRSGILSSPPLKKPAPFQNQSKTMSNSSRIPKI